MNIIRARRYHSFVGGIAEVASGVLTKAANFLENSLGKAVPIVIGFLANQVGLSGIGKRIGELIGKAREMVDKAIEWLVNKAVDTAFGLIDRLTGKGGAEPKGQSPEEKYGPEKAAKISEGLKAIETAEEPLLNSGKINKEEAEKVANTVKSNHPVFTTLEVVDGGDKWNFRYTASDPTIVTGKPKDNGLPVELTVGESILDKNDNNGYRVKELNVNTSVGVALKVEDSPVLFLYSQYGTRWEKPAGKPPFVAFSVSGGPTDNRTARITVDNAHLNTGTGANIPRSVAAAIGYDTSGHWPRAGHLVANSLGGPGGYTTGNIVPMTFNANQTNTGMRGIEDAVLRDIKGADAVYDYSVSASYNTAIQLPPVEVVVTANRLYPTTALPTTVASLNPKTVNNT